MKKNLVLLNCIGVLLLSACATRNKVLQLSSTNYEKRYSAYIDKDATIIRAEYSFVKAKLANGNYVFYTFFPENKSITRRTEYKDNKMSMPTGTYREFFWDTGKLQVEGKFDGNGNKTGLWTAYYSDGKVEKTVEYLNDMREGKDIYFLPFNNDTLEILSYKKGKLEGESKFFDDKGKLYYSAFYKNDQLTKKRKKQQQLGIDKEASLFHITCNSKDSLRQYNCSRSALKNYLKLHFSFPKVAQELGVQGTSIVGFTIEEDGSISNINIKKGLCASTNEATLDLVKSMPKWNPAYVNGTVAKQLYLIPLRYKNTLLLDSGYPKKQIFMDDNIFCNCK